MDRLIVGALLAMATVSVLSTAAAQEAPAGSVDDALVVPGTLADDRTRDRHLLGAAGTDGYLIRSPSSISPETGIGIDLRLVPPTVEAVWNSRIPYSWNDGSLWAGKGLSIAARTGFRLTWGPLSLVAAPELLHIQNSDTPIRPSAAEERSDFASPWHSGQHGTADLPLRFGNQPLTIVGAGQSSVTLSARGFSVGGATENQWWGPGIRNALVLSNHAPGFPHLFLRSSHPWRTGIGDFEWKWIAGVLTESIYFDSLTTNDNRAIGAAVATYRPSFGAGLTIGVARSVIQSIPEADDFLGHAAAPFAEWASASDAAPEEPTLSPHGSDEILSVFGRYVLPRSGLEVYGEWARLETPRSLRDLLTLPGHSSGFTVGAQYLGGTPERPGLRLLAEATSLEKSGAARQQPSPTFYLGRSTAHGYTHRGQILGAAVGPGGSSQWAAVDYFLDRSTSVGIVGGRVRWENDTFYTLPLVSRFDHDVTVMAGVRMASLSRWGDLSTQLLLSRRYNYLFQHRLADPVRPRDPVDLNSVSLRIEITPG